jgi:hypothetical protein
MLDANGDYFGKDTDLRSFLSSSFLCDPFFEKFCFSPPTNVDVAW